MNFISRNIFPATITFLIAAVLGSCSDNKLNESLPGGNGDRNVRLVLNLSTLSAGVRSSENEPSEKVKSIRVIMLNGEGYVEVNELIEFNNRFPDAGNFSYLYTTDTYIGHKEFFFIANERSVNDGVTLEQITADGETPVVFPADLPTQTLTDLLNYFQPEYIPAPAPPVEGEGQGSDLDMTAEEEGEENDGLSHTQRGELFKKVLNSIVFTPNYEINGGEIYLPYSAYYPGFDYILDENGNYQINVGDGYKPSDYAEIPMYLVPVATKIYFNFVNNRNNVVEVSDIRIGGIADSNFFFPQLDENELYRGNRKDTWWIDWLREISNNSTDILDPSENEGFNNINGWISKYSMPSTAYPADNTDTDTDSQEIPGWRTLVGSDKLVVNGYTSDNGAEEESIGPFYLSESNYIVTKESFDAAGNIWPQQVQEYYLSISMYDPVNKTYADFEKVAIGNLKALFRNTSIKITISMRDWDDNGAYAEFQAWGTNEKNGFITEEEP